MKSILLKTITLILFVFVFFYLIPSKSVVFGASCTCAGRYCYAECSYCTGYPTYQYAYSDEGGVTGACTGSSDCRYGPFGGMAGCSPTGWSITIPCSSCTGGYYEDTGVSPPQFYNTYTCLNYNRCAGGGNGNGGGGGVNLSCTNITILGERDGSGNLIVGNTYNVNATYNFEGQGNPPIKIMAAKYGDDCRYYWRDDIPEHNQYPFTWAPTQTGTYIFWCIPLASGFGSCASYTPCKGDGTTCNPPASLTVNVVDPIPPGIIQGRKVLMPGNQIGLEPAKSQTVTINTSPPKSSSNDPYFLTEIPLNTDYTVSVSLPSGYQVEYTRCYNDTGCHNGPRTLGSSATIEASKMLSENYVACTAPNVPAGCDPYHYADLWWHFTPPSCDVDLLPASASILMGAKIPFDASVTIHSGTVSSVSFSSLPSTIASVSPASDSDPVYSTEATGVGVGTATVTADVVMSGATTPPCTDTSTLTVTVPGPWWQVKDADVTTRGDLISPIPGSCTLPVCNPVFGLRGAGGFPGVPAYGGTTADFQAGAGTGRAAEDPYNWLVASSYQGKIYDYAYFARQIPPDVTFTEITTPTVNGGDFNSGGAPSRGYVWYHYNGATLGDMIISGNVNLTGSRRVVLLIEGADLYITGRIGIQSPGNGFFMAVVGKDANGLLKGNIIVDPAVSHPTNPGLEGIFVAEGEFRTGAGGTNQLWVRGSVVAYDKISLDRNLQALNSTKPAELFEYSPELMLVFPQVFTSRRMRWKEVAP